MYCSAFWYSDEYFNCGGTAELSAPVLYSRSSVSAFNSDLSSFSLCNVRTGWLGIKHQVTYLLTHFFGVRMSASAFNSAACPYTCVVSMSAFNNDCPLVVCYGLIPYLFIVL